MKKTKKGFFVILMLYFVMIFGILCEAQEMEVLPVELDMGDYQSEMIVGEKQLLTVTVLPEDTTNQNVAYASSNAEVATINGMGRITALTKGSTTITASCGNVSAYFELTVKEKENTEIPVTDLDLGDCPKEITIGTSQLLSVAVIPANATDTNFTYKSSKKSVASVNELGRLTANKLGTAEITVSCGKIKKSFTVTVVEDDSIEKEIEVTDIEIGDYEEELNVDETLNLTVTVLPSDATDATVVYQSSDPAVATVNSTGEVKGIAAGEVIIYIVAGKVRKQVPVTVKIATTAINLNTEYKVMKPGDSFELKASVQPTGAAGKITYSSIDPEIASVTSSGTITAKKCGNTAIVVSNGDLQVSVTVIVNEDGVIKENKTELSKDTQEETEFSEEVTVAECKTITSEMLRYFYENRKLLTINGEDYTIYIDGKDIVNCENEFQTEILFEQQKQGFTFEVNEGKKLCGKLTVMLGAKVTNEKYLYLYNDEKGKYQRVNAEDMDELVIDTAGIYLLSQNQLHGFRFNAIFVAVSVIIIVIGIGIYIALKKQYWFW